MLSFGRPFPQHSPHLFPETSFYNYLVAPFWTDNDITRGVGEVSYQVYEDSEMESLSWVSTYISQQQQADFRATWMLVAEWRNVPEYLGEEDSVISSCMGSGTQGQIQGLTGGFQTTPWVSQGGFQTTPRVPQGVSRPHPGSHKGVSRPHPGSHKGVSRPHPGSHKGVPRPKKKVTGAKCKD